MAPENSVEALAQLAGLAVKEVVLHRGEMLLLDRLVEAKPESAVCEWQVGEGDVFLVPGLGIPGYVGIEYMAQCVAAHAGARARIQGDPPPLGFLLGTRHYQCTARYFEPGIVYRASCEELVRNSDGMGSYKCTISREMDTIAQGNLAVWEKDRTE